MTARRAAAVLALAVALAWLGGAAAGAQGEPPPPDEPTTTTTVAPSPTTTAAPSQVEQTTNDVTAVFTGPQIGNYPDSRYRYYTGDGSAQVSTNVPGPLDDVARAATGLPTQVDTGVPTERTVNGTVADWWWTIPQDLATVLRSLVHWLYTFGFLRAITPIVEMLAGLLNGVLVGPLRIQHVVIVFTGLALAFRLLTHRRFGSFLADAAIALVLVLAAGILIARPGVYFDGTATLAGEVAQLPFRLLNPEHPDDGLLEVEGALKQAWTEVPWQVINFGHELKGPCLDAGNRILADGPYGKTDITPRVTLVKAGCQQEAKYNNDSNGIRFGIVILLAVSFVFSAMFIVSMAFGFLRASWRLALHFSYGLAALLFGSTPYTHDMAVGWIKRVTEDLLAMIVPSWLLGAMLIADRALIGLGDVALGWRLLLIIGANAGIFWKRRVIVNSVAHKLTGGMHRLSARTLRADHANIGQARRNTDGQGAHHAHDFMPGSSWVTVPVAAAVVAAGRHTATGGKHVSAARSAAAKTVGGPVGAGVRAGVEGAKRARTAGQDVSSAAAGVSQRAGAATAARTAEWRQKRDAKSGQGHAPLGDVHGPPAPAPPSPDADLLPGWEDVA